ncbi:hypothetical protein ACJMK2_014806 [Sinanodonta woodiana]|uniref:TIR domain-containing protein n=1 Tax=Sinanodonta woodiana TaxID=1069815 RepID=A0ABD3V1R9_SINWO
MGSFPSHSSRKPISERSRSQWSPSPTNTNGPIDEEESSSLSLHESTDDEIRSNLSTDQSDTEIQAISQVDEDAEDDLDWLNEEPNQEQNLTSQEKLSRKTNLFRLLNKAIHKFKKCLSSEHEDEKWTNELSEQLSVIADYYSNVLKIGSLSVDDINKYRREAGKQLSRTQTVPLICNVITKEWQKCAEQLVSNAIELPSDIMLSALMVLWNFSDCSPEVTFDIIKESAFLQTLKYMLTSFLQERIQGDKMNEDVKMIIARSLSIIHNLSNVDENITPLREGGFVNYVSPYLVSKRILDRFKALATLASLIDEKESECLLQGKYKLLKKFLEAFETAVEASPRWWRRKEEVWSAFELALTIHRLARNHANKPLLVQMGCLPHLTKLAMTGNIQETRVAVGAVWYLAFCKDNQIRMLEDKELKFIVQLNAIKENSKDKITIEKVDGTIWQLRKQLQNNDNFKDKVRSSSRQESSSDGHRTKQKKGHIMISYSWSNKKVARKIKDNLKAYGYAVWIDIENMESSTVEAMAKAVEMSHVVLICMSQKYNQSRTCQKEAEYAYQLNKRVVVIKMEQDYKPYGWLGFIVGTDLYYDFSGKYEFETKFEELLKRMKVLYGEGRSKTNNHTAYTKTKVHTMPNMAPHMGSIYRPYGHSRTPRSPQHGTASGHQRTPDIH